MARALADAGISAVFSYAGRTRQPVGQPLPVRVGGFGGVEGLAAYLRTEAITHLIDATHPFAAQISRNAVEAAAVAAVPLVALQRPPWQAKPGDDWRHVPDAAAAAAALPTTPARVFLAIGRQNLDAFAVGPQHHYLLRLVDPAETLPLPRVTVELARGPFTVAGDTALMARHGTQIVVAKNAGGEGARAKLDAARASSLPVVMIARPAIPQRREAGTVAEVMAWLAEPVHPHEAGRTR